MDDIAEMCNAVDSLSLPNSQSSNHPRSRSNSSVSVTSPEFKLISPIYGVTSEKQKSRPVRFFQSSNRLYPAHKRPDNNNEHRNSIVRGNTFGGIFVHRENKENASSDEISDDEISDEVMSKADFGLGSNFAKKINFNRYR